jgi:hypothetical protein
MGSMEHLTEIAERLRRLQATSPDSKPGVDSWEQQARDFSDWLSRGPEVTLPAQLWHYLHDADIRIKEPEYRAAQEAMITEIIRNLERGIVPASIGTTISFHPRWFGVFALVFLAIIMYWAVR